MFSALGVGISTALCLLLRAGAADADVRTLTLSPHSFDATSGLLQLDARLSFAVQLESRMLLALSSTATAPVATRCMFDGGEGPTLTAVVGTGNSSGRDCSGTLCPPSLDSTCGFQVQQLQADGSSRYSGHMQVWLGNATQVARVFSGAVSFQIPLASLALAVGAIKPLKVVILAWCLALVCCVLTPVKWWPRPPPLPAAPPPPPHPAIALRSTLQFCATQPGNLTYVNGGIPLGDVVLAGETYCLEQLVFNLPRSSTLVAHAVYVNGSAVPIAAGTEAHLVTPGPLSWAPAAVRFPFTFPAVGLLVLDSVSVFHLASGGNLSAAATGAHRMLPPASAPAEITAVVITQLAQFNISTATAAGAVAKVEQELLGAYLATAQFTAAAHKVDPLAASFTSFRRRYRL